MLFKFIVPLFQILDKKWHFARIRFLHLQYFKCVYCTCFSHRRPYQILINKGFRTNGLQVLVFVLREKNNCTSWVIHKYHNTTKTVNSSHKLERKISCWLRLCYWELLFRHFFDLSHSVLVETSSTICPFQAAEYIWAKEKLTNTYHNRNDKTKHSMSFSHKLWANIVADWEN